MVVAAACLVIMGQPFVHATSGRNKDKEENLTARIGRETNPGKKARLQLRLARLKLSEADAAYQSRNFDEGKALLRQYLDQIRNSWTTLQGSDVAVRKHLGAFKELEISLREDHRFLEDLRHRVPYPNSEAIEEIANENNVVHNQVLGAIFPAGLSPKGKRKQMSSPKSSMPVRPASVKS
jgi:hypothetical protein